MIDEHLSEDRQKFQSHIQLKVNVAPSNQNPILETSQIYQVLRDDQKNNQQQKNQENQAKLHRNFIDGGNFEFVSTNNYITHQNCSLKYFTPVFGSILITVQIFILVKVLKF